jgi:hypothetical protein
VGGPADQDAGAAWVYTRSNGVWTQQGSKLVGTGAVTPAVQGWSVALSGDGNTAIVGGYQDNSAGAAWVYTRSNGVWTQQGSKLVGTGAVGNATQGRSVALSTDGNTAIVGGPDDTSNAGADTGAAWVYTRSNGVWTQQGSKLVGTDAVTPAGQGWSVALSGDGNTAIVGGYQDNLTIGAAWVYTRSNGVWTQQGSKLVGSGAVGSAYQGYSVSLSADGNTAFVGGYVDNSGIGAAWVYTRSNGVWTQQGSKLVGTGAGGLPPRPPSKVSPLRCPVTATPPLWADLTIVPARTPTTIPGQHGSLPAAAVYGPSRAANWSALAQLHGLSKAGPLHCPATATLPSWPGIMTTPPSERRGSSSSRVRRCKPPPPLTWSPPAFQADRSLRHRSNIS